jgi:hypothetical protein
LRHTLAQYDQCHYSSTDPAKHQGAGPYQYYQQRLPPAAHDELR